MNDTPPVDDLHTHQLGLDFALHQVDNEREQFIVTRPADGHVLTSTLFVAEARLNFNELVAAWIDDRLGVTPPASVTCASCETVLQPALGTDTDYQFDNALWVTFSGGYSMFIDPVGTGDPKVVICHECAHELCEQHPWINTLLDPEHSHAHLEHDHEQLLAAGHIGWDLTPPTR